MKERVLSLVSAVAISLSMALTVFAETTGTSDTEGTGEAVSPAVIVVIAAAAVVVVAGIVVAAKKKD